MAQDISKMETTAVEWLEKIYKEGILIPKSFEIAKQMEKEQIMDSYKDGVYQALDNDADYDNWWNFGEQYYNETYNK